MAHDHAPDGGKKGSTAEGRHNDQSSNKHTEPVIRNVHAIVELEKKTLEDRKNFSRLSEVVSNLAASPAFIAGHCVVFAGWIILNTTHFAFDRHPFDLLNLILAFEAILLTSIVLIAQRDLKRVTDLRGHLDLQVNILAEQELTAILALLNKICRRIGIDPKKAEPDVEQFSGDTDLRTIATMLEKTLDEE
jgi:uncharacterized membrane protein